MASPSFPLAARYLEMPRRKHLKSFRHILMDYLGIGACVVAARHRTALHVPLEHRKHIVYVKDDLSGPVALCRYYLEHDRERAQIARNGREFFDQSLHRDRLARYCLATLFAATKD